LAASAAPVRATAPQAEAKKPEPEAQRPAATAAQEAARAKALLEAKADPKATVAKEAPAPATSREGGRFVVQAGAFADAAAAREMRAKLEKLGLKSYTQVVETSSGSRTRVRAGPYATREEAEKALAKAKAAGVGAVVLTL
jgi:DedD protein